MRFWLALLIELILTVTAYGGPKTKQIWVEEFDPHYGRILVLKEVPLTDSRNESGSGVIVSPATPQTFIQEVCPPGQP